MTAYAGAASQPLAPIIPEPAALKAVLLGGAGIGRLPDFATANSIAEVWLIRLFPDQSEDAVEVHAPYPSHRSLSAKVRVFIDALAERLKGAS